MLLVQGAALRNSKRLCIAAKTRSRSIILLTTAWLTGATIRLVRCCRPVRSGREVGRIEIILAGDTYKREESIASSVCQCRAHTVWGRGLADRANRPVRGDPLARRMRQNRGEVDDAAGLVDRGCLHNGDLMLAEDLADAVEPA